MADRRELERYLRPPLRAQAQADPAAAAQAPRGPVIVEPRPLVVRSGGSVSAPARRSRPLCTSPACTRSTSARTRSSTPPTASLLGSIPAERNREPVTLGRMSPWLPKATVAVEDRRFYEHGGSTTSGSSARSGRDVERRQGRRGRLDDQPAARPQPVHGPRAHVRAQDQGGVPRDQAERPLDEEQDPPDLSQHRLLRQPCLRRRGGRADVLLAAGAEPNLPQAALLAGLPQAPSIYDPLHNPNAAIARRSEVLRAMFDEPGDHPQAVPLGDRGRS